MVSQKFGKCDICDIVLAGQIGSQCDMGEILFPEGITGGGGSWKGVGTTEKKARIRERRGRRLYKRGLAVWACIDSSAVMGEFSRRCWGAVAGLAALDRRYRAGVRRLMMGQSGGVAQAVFVMVVEAEGEGWDLLESGAGEEKSGGDL